ncbi:preprotein translocase subunit YajC [Clostridium sp. MSJ-11]|uniref:Preprotein translocase subunit YajC n=2 Tax=Clostridium mobile TaxID=2841512 RepID=A0ABS6EKG2_9CLOT|nr:preprotein translocase subunit YajC [Clostridium mobile]MBU5485533.1 preprotein translocase subunit YajC [Clostridium mobile]
MLGLFLPFIIMMLFFYIIVYIPESRRKKKYRGMLDSLKVNDEIITKGGILGKVINIQDTFIILESGPSRARIKLDKNGILSILNTSEAAVEDKKEDKKEDKAEDKAEENESPGYKEN